MLTIMYLVNKNLYITLKTKLKKMPYNKDINND